MTPLRPKLKKKPLKNQPVTKFGTPEKNDT